MLILVTMIYWFKSIYDVLLNQTEVGGVEERKNASNFGTERKNHWMSSRVLHNCPTSMFLQCAVGGVVGITAHTVTRTHTKLMSHKAFLTIMAIQKIYIWQISHFKNTHHARKTHCTELHSKNLKFHDVNLSIYPWDRSLSCWFNVFLLSLMAILKLIVSLKSQVSFGGMFAWLTGVPAYHSEQWTCWRQILPHIGYWGLPINKIFFRNISKFLGFGAV